MGKTHKEFADLVKLLKLKKITSAMSLRKMSHMTLVNFEHNCCNRHHEHNLFAKFSLFIQ